MKKILLFAVLALVPASMFASYYSSGSSALTILGVILIVFAIVLNIILFIKIWGMTNNVARLTKYILDGKWKEVECPTPSTRVSRAKLQADIVETKSKNLFEVGQHVISLDTKEDFVVNLVNECKKPVTYYSSQLGKYFNEDELMDYEAYKAQK